MSNYPDKGVLTCLLTNVVKKVAFVAALAHLAGISLAQILEVAIGRCRSYQSRFQPHGFSFTRQGCSTHIVTGVGESECRSQTGRRVSAAVEKPS